MTDFLDRSTVLVLNSLYQPIGTISPKKALVALNSASDQCDIAAKAIDIQYAVGEDGKYDLETVETFTPCSFEEWLNVTVRPGLDQIIHTSKMQIRCPTVVITNYSKIPMRRFRATKSVLYEMQKGICGYSGVKCNPKQLNIEHKLPRSKGGKDTFENLMLVKKEINFARGNKPMKELGLKPLFRHQEPKPIPASFTIKTAVHPDWGYFIQK
jgi:5-methylcytosine-specific restriction endonuclease McrA